MRRVLIVAILLVLAVVFLRTAWVAEDAYITYRVIDNFVHGHGLTWNTVERVQAYTHPLWLFLITVFYVVTREPYYTGIVLSMLVSLLAVGLLAFKVAKTPIAATLGLTALLFSRAFVDYATCGMENPLTHLLLVLFLLVYFRSERSDARAFFKLCLVAALALLTRMDVLLLLLPALAYRFFRLPKAQAAKAALVAFSPFIAWELFSLVYYGAFVPNSALAKLNTGIQRSELLGQGVFYLFDALRNDPVTLLTIVVGSVAAVVSRKREHITIATGCGLYVLYVVWIGGDFMSGRFFTAPLIASVALLSSYPLERARVWVPAVAVIVAVGFVPSLPPAFSGTGYGVEKNPLYHGIADERAYYFQDTGLFRVQGKGVEDHPKAVEGRAWRPKGWHARLGGMVGFLGYYSGPESHILDGFALSDPLLARLPERGLKWRVGHFTREVPEGYLNTLLHKKNMLEDKRLAELYDAISLITREPLFATGRMSAIWKINTGGYGHLVEPFFKARHLQEDAVKLLDQGSFREAAAKAGEAAKLDPRRAAAWCLRSRALLRLGDLRQARLAAVRAIRIRSGEYENELLAVGEAYGDEGDTATAIEIFQQLVEQDAENVDARVALARTFEREGRVEDALREFRRALLTAPDQPGIQERITALERER